MFYCIVKVFNNKNKNIINVDFYFANIMKRKNGKVTIINKIEKIVLLIFINLIIFIVLFNNPGWPQGQAKN